MNINLCEKLNKLDVYLATEFRNSVYSSNSDIDIAIVLNQEFFFENCLLSIVNIIKEINNWEIQGTITPSFELASLLQSSEKYPMTHLLIYPAPWIFEVMESPGVKNAILSAAGKNYQEIVKEPPDYIKKFFDLLQKIINSLVLLLNKEPMNKRIAEVHAFRVAKYVKRWIFIELPCLNGKESVFSFEQAWKFYSIVK